MNGQKNASPLWGGILYGFGGLSAVTEVVFLLLFLQSYAAVHGAVLATGAALGLALPVLIMPLFYALVNGNTAIGTGRYHLPLVISGLAGALAFVLLAGVGKGNAGAQTAALLGLAFLFSSARQIFWYTYFSIGQRFDRTDAVQKYRGVFSLCAVFAASVLSVLLADVSRDGVRAVTAVAGIIAALGVLTVYFGTVHAMPSFIRLEPYHKRSLKETYRRFVSPLKNRAVRLFAVAALFTSAGASFAAAALPAGVFGGLLGITRGFKPAVLVAAIAMTAAGVYGVTGTGGRKTGDVTLIALTAVLAAAAAAAAVAVCLPVPQVVSAAALFVLAALAGITLGTNLSCELRGKPYAARLCGCTLGRYACLHRCVVTVGMAAGVALAAAVRAVITHLGLKTGCVAAFAVFALLLLAAALVRRAGQADKFWRKQDEEQAARAALTESVALESVPAEEEQCSP